MPKKVLSDESTFFIVLKLGELSYESKGASALDALNNLVIPPKLAVKGILTLRRGDIIKEFVMAPFKLKRLFYPLARFYMAKSFELLMK